MTCRRTRVACGRSGTATAVRLGRTGRVARRPRPDSPRLNGAVAGSMAAVSPSRVAEQVSLRLLGLPLGIRQMRPVGAAGFPLRSCVLRRRAAVDVAGLPGAFALSGEFVHGRRASMASRRFCARSRSRSSRHRSRSTLTRFSASTVRPPVRRRSSPSARMGPPAYRTPQR